MPKGLWGIIPSQRHRQRQPTDLPIEPPILFAVIHSLALLISLAGMVLYPIGSRSLSQLNWSTSGVALGIIGIEIGFLLAYRAGWSMGYAALSANALTTLVLLPLG